MKVFKYASETLHIALVSLSQGQARDHIASLLKDYYRSYRKGILHYSKGTSPESNEFLYQPLEYFIFGNYDIALISVVNNYKFSQKQPTPRIENISQINTTEPNLFQVITGSCPLISKKFDVGTFFKKKQEETEVFICITNLKLNNKLLIGNGNSFLEPVLSIIDKKIREIFSVADSEISNNYFLQQTYSWCEITLVVFADQIKQITNVITGLRKLALNDLFESDTDPRKMQILTNSLYQNVLKTKTEYKNVNPHLFADSHSYFGVHTKALKDRTKKKILSQELRTQIEWQVKPGHFANLARELAKIKVNNKLVFGDKNFFLTGKTDFFIQENTNSFLNNIKLIENLSSNPNIFKYARKVKSRVLLDYAANINEPNKHDSFHADFKKVFQTKFLNEIPHPNEVNNILKELKISRNIRSKITKIFFNYQNGIQDPILFTYFLDFKIFINNLANLIKEEGRIYRLSFLNLEFISDYGSRGIDMIENSLIKMIEIFEEGYNIRMLNCNQYEDINDFDLDFNSSVQQILSMYGTIAVKIGNIFFKKNTQGSVVQLNLKNTVSNFESINYDVYHLTCPEFVLFTLVKEVMNKYTYANEQTVRKDSGKGSSIKKIMKELECEFFECTNFYDNEIVDFEYYFIDAIRFIHTCNFDFKLFEYWFWTYTFQNASLYDKTGTFNERHFRMELLRLFFVSRLFGISIETIKCPLPEIYYLWERHAKSFIEIVNLFFKFKSPTVSAFKIKILSVFKYPNSFNPPQVTKKTESDFKRINQYIAEGLTAKDKSDFIKHDKFHLVNLSLNILSNKERISKLIDNGIPVYCSKEEETEYLFINSFVFAYLKLIFEKNKKVRLLRRNWENGKPLLSFIDDNEPSDEFLYSVDQFGGIFFSSDSKSEEYFKIRNATLQSLWHFSLLSKKAIYFSK